MTLLVAERGLRDRRRGLLGWSIGLAAYVTFQASFYPSVQNSDLQRAVAGYPKELKAFFGGAQAFDFSTGRGYLEVELFSMVIPALLAIAAIAYGAAALAGEQEHGTLDLVLATPISRRRLVLEKLLGVAVTTFALAGVVAVAVTVTSELFALDLSIINVVAACLGAALAAFFFGALALLTGGASGSRAASIAAPAALFLASYLLVGLAGLVDWLKPFRLLSPLYHANGTHPLANGFPSNFFILAALGIGTVVASVLIFERREL
jgi:ABC-2 type transport system permease protein